MKIGFAGNLEKDGIAEFRVRLMNQAVALGEQTDAAIAELGGMPEVHPGIAVMRGQGA